MILYTPLAESDIFPPSPDDYTNRHCISVDGKLMIAERTEDGAYKMVQLLSTDPQDYLNQNYAPGTTFS